MLVEGEVVYVVGVCCFYFVVGCVFDCVGEDFCYVGVGVEDEG